MAIGGELLADGSPRFLQVLFAYVGCLEGSLNLSEGLERQPLNLGRPASLFHPDVALGIVVQGDVALE